MLYPRGIALFSVFIFAGTVEAQASGAERIAEGAAARVGRTVLYDPAYVRVPYPMGDVPDDRGVCTDVVVRALRHAGVDLQAAVHRDMRANFGRYPHRWGLVAPDRNIDHRRVPNLMRFFERRGKSLPVGSEPFRAGDVVAWRLPGGRLHMGVVVGGRNGRGRPLVAHNIGRGTRIEDVLQAYELIGHYRWFAR